MSAWLDMAQYPEVDPEAALTAEESHLLRGLLTQPVQDVPEEAWRRMLDVTWSSVDGDVPADDVDLDDSGAPDHHDPGSVDAPGPTVVGWDGSHGTDAFHDDSDDMTDGDDG